VLQCAVVCCNDRVGAARWRVEPASPSRSPNGSLRCSVLQCIVVCCSILQCVAACCNLQVRAWRVSPSHHLSVVSLCCSVVLCVAACCSMLQHVAVCCNFQVGAWSRARNTPLHRTCHMYLFVGLFIGLFVKEPSNKTQLQKKGFICRRALQKQGDRCKRAPQRGTFSRKRVIRL